MVLGEELDVVEVQGVVEVHDFEEEVFDVLVEEDGGGLGGVCEFLHQSPNPSLPLPLSRESKERLLIDMAEFVLDGEGEDLFASGE